MKETDIKFEYLVAAVAHDLKNQLQALNNQQDHVLQSIPAQYHELLLPMQRKTQQIKDDALRLVSLFRLEHHQKFPMDEGWPRDTVADAVEFATLQYPDVRITNHVDIDAQGFYNEQLVQLALVTLMSNSAQAGASQIDIHADAQTDNSNSVRLTLTDNGPGFEEEILNGNLDTTKPDGTGLGLMFVEMICQAHEGGGRKGDLTYGNTEGGAQASLYLP